MIDFRCRAKTIVDRVLNDNNRLWLNRNEQYWERVAFVERYIKQIAKDAARAAKR